MNEFLEYINGILADLVNDFSAHAGVFLIPAKIIAGIGAIIAVYMVYKKSVTDGEKVNMNEIYRIFALYLGILFYGTFIGLINAPLNLMSNSIKSVAIDETSNTDDFFDSFHTDKESDKSIANNQDYNNTLNDYINQSERELGVSLEEEVEQGFGDKIIEIFNPSNLYEQIQSYLIEAFFNVIHFLGVIAILVLNVIRSFFMIVLTYFGIFVLALSMYPGLQNSFFQWLQKYINVFLWLPISYILQGVISKMFTYFQTANPISTGGIAASLSNTTIALVGLCSIIGFATVPTMSSWLINAATSTVGSKLKQKAGGAIQQGKGALKGAIKAKATGGASVAAGAIAKK